MGLLHQADSEADNTPGERGYEDELGVPREQVEMALPANLAPKRENGVDGEEKLERVGQPQPDGRSRGHRWRRGCIRRNNQLGDGRGCGDVDWRFSDLRLC